MRIKPSPSFPSAVAISGIYFLYMPKPRKGTAERKAKIFRNNRSQAVRLPKEFQFKTAEVFIRKVGNDVVLSPRPLDWSSYLAEAPVASAGFMEGIEDLPVQEREP
jgi:antitoxin VapB